MSEAERLAQFYAAQREAFEQHVSWAKSAGVRRYKWGEHEIEFFAPADPPGPQFGDLSPEQLRAEATRRERAEQDGKEADIYGASE